MMKHQQILQHKEIEVSNYCNKNETLKASVISFGEGFYVDFFKDEVLIDSITLMGKSLQYAEDIAKKFVDGSIGFDPKTWRVYGIF